MSIGGLLGDGGWYVEVNSTETCSDPSTSVLLYRGVIV